MEVSAKDQRIFGQRAKTPADSAIHARMHCRVKPWQKARASTVPRPRCWVTACQKARANHLRASP